MNYKAIAPKTIGHLYEAHASIRQSEVDESLIALIELRVAQVNGCAYCCAFHSNELRNFGLPQELVDKIPGYRHSASFSREQELVLRYADAVTTLSADLDDIKKQLALHFSDKQLVEITASAALMNALTRLRIVLGEKY